MTRAQEAAVKAVVNATLNLNVTPATVNQAKKGPFLAFRNLMREHGGWRPGASERCLQDLARRSASAAMPDMLDDGTWARIEHTLSKSADDVLLHVRADGVEGARSGGAARMAALFADQVEDMVVTMRLAE
ncbi:hypothetical protein EON68_03860 [archaeon]|nr:MAG: hypothetical protein EON68_03860 [archaeon]